MHNPSPSPASKAETVPVSIIIPHYNDIENLKHCLKLLDAQTIARGKFEVIVADNNSRIGIDALQSICGDRVKVIPAPIQGAGEARNAGVLASVGRVLAFIDSDCRPEPRWLENGLLALYTSKASVIGGRVDIDYVDSKNPTAAEAFEKVFAFNFKEYIEKKNFTGSGNMFVSRDTFDKVGGFRVGVAEDLDWSRRAVAKGYRLSYADNAIVSHPARKDFEELRAKWKRSTREAYLATIETRHGKLIWLIRSWAILISPPLHVPTILKSRKLHGAKQKLKAVGALFYIRGWRFIECQRIMLRP